MADNPRVYRPVRFTDTFKRKTIRIEEPLLEQIQELSSNRKGEQTRIINSALAEYFANHNGYIQEMEDVPTVNKQFHVEASLKDKLIALAGGGRQQAVFNTALKLYLADPMNVAKHAQVGDWYASPESFWKDIKIQRMDDQEV